jgi:hypothetical protein
LHQIFRSLTHRRLLISFRSDRSSQLLTRFPSLYTTVSAKMVQNQGIDVYLAPFDDYTRRYQQHTVPAASPNFKNDSNEVYIEAADGERFLVMVELLKDFDAKGGTHLSIEYEVDESGGINGYPSLSALKEKTH